MLVRRVLFLVVVLGGCVAADDASTPGPGITAIVETGDGGTAGVAGDDAAARARADVRASSFDGTPLALGSDGPDLCGLAAALPPDDPCSQICDPEALKALLIAQGAATGRCYQLGCALTEDVHVQVGVCLPPS